MQANVGAAANDVASGPSTAAGSSSSVNVLVVAVAAVSALVVVGVALFVAVRMRRSSTAAPSVTRSAAMMARPAPDAARSTVDAGVVDNTSDVVINLDVGTDNNA